MRLKLSDIDIESACMPGVTSAAGLQSSAGKPIEKITPEIFGTMSRNGLLCGDSGYAMEEMLLGGRLRHRHIQGRDLFQVMVNVSVLALCQSTPVFLQVETLILVVNEPVKEQSEMWLSDEYVEKLIGLLESG
jgi:hypothetical protein